MIFNKVELKDEEFITGKHTSYLDHGGIVEIIRPVRKYERKFIKVQKDTDNDDMFYAWIMYIAWMLFMSITTGAIQGWIVGTYIFYKYRRKQLYREDKNR